MEINQVSQTTLPGALALLKKNNLPTEDISGLTKLFVLTNNDTVIGTIGIEFYKDVALLRSLAVAEEYRNKGVGKKLVEHIESLAKQHDAKELILLTTTAPHYFTKRAYQIIERHEAPAEIKNSSEFTSTCPASAVTMRKVL
jgi:amino-acid N-acetyltransferase